jgi:Ca2+/H+ antiporter, TMEM165/GDT1 family
MVLKALLVSLALIFVAELGDKTQLTVLALSARFKKPLEVFIGAAIAFALLNGVAVGLGAAGTLLPADLVHMLASIIFVAVGLASLSTARMAKERGEVEEEEEVVARSRRGPLVTAFLMICLMELGDKTQISMLALTSRFGSPLSVFIGGTVALWLSALLAALVGGWLARVVPVKTIRALSGGLFILFGLLTALHAY